MASIDVQAIAGMQDFGVQMSAHPQQTQIAEPKPSKTIDTQTLEPLKPLTTSIEVQAIAELRDTSVQMSAHSEKWPVSRP